MPSRTPAWIEQVDTKFYNNNCDLVYINDWTLSEEVLSLKTQYTQRFGQDAVNKRIPIANWRCADIFSEIVPRDMPILDIGSGLGEFANLYSIKNQNSKLTSVDIKDYDLYFDFAGRRDRIYKNIFELGVDEKCVVVTCFEVIEHLPPHRLPEVMDILRALAKRKLFVSVPFKEPLPLYPGHYTRFTESNLSQIMPVAKFTIFAKDLKNSSKIYAWILAEINV